MTRIRVRSLGILMVLAASMSACSALEPQTLAFADADLEPRVIRVATDDAAGLADPLAEWDRNHPTVSVDLQVLDVDDLRALALADPLIDAAEPPDAVEEAPSEIPDVVVFDSSWAPDVRARSRLFLDLNTFGAEVWRPQSIEWRWAAGTVDDAQISVPLDAGGLALAWRADLVDPALNDLLPEVDSWCSVIDFGDRHADDSGNAFLPEVSSFFSAIVEQVHLDLRDGDALVHESNPRIRLAWDLSMRALGEDALFADPCPELDDVQRIASTISPGTAEWAAAIADGLVAAQLVSSHDLLDLEAESPPSARWRSTTVPGIVAPDHGRTLAIRADSASPALAWDLVATLAAPSTQRRTHDATGRIPTASRLLEPGVLGGPASMGVGSDEFTSALVASVNARTSFIDDEATGLVLGELAAAVDRVAAGSQIPRDAWDEAVWRIGQKLS